MSEKFILGNKKMSHKTGSGQSNSLCHGGTTTRIGSADRQEFEGYFHGSQTKKDKRNFDYGQNYIDRLRFNRNDTCEPNPCRRSGWRQKSVSHLDLATATTKPTSQQNQSRRLRTNKFSDLNNNSSENGHTLLQSYTKFDPERAYEQYFFEDYDEKLTGDDYYQHFDPSNEVCSLRRTRSLAVIREETFNDLNVSGAHETRRSQLIPRAKLVDRSFFRERFQNRKNNHQKNQQRNGCSEDHDNTILSGGSIFADNDEIGDSLTGTETRESEDYYKNLKRLDSVKIFTSPWLGDRSDLESLNSDYFKNSLHQNSGGKEKYRKNQSQSRNSRRRKYKILEAEIHNDYSQSSSAFPESTTASNSEQSDSCSNFEHEDDRTQSKKNLKEDYQEIYKSEQEENTSESGTLTLKKKAIKKISEAVISYDSVYLSSEESTADDATVVFENDHFSKEDNNYYDSNKKDHDIPGDKNLQEVEELYRKVQKNSSTKPRILGFEKKAKPIHTSGIKRGTLERLTYISTSQILKTNDVRVIDVLPNLIGNQYHSLPDINIGRSLNVSEHIDAKLRSSYGKHRHHHDNYSEEKDFEYSIEDSPDNCINHFGRTFSKKVRQREFSEIDLIIRRNIPPSSDLSIPKDEDNLPLPPSKEVVFSELESILRRPSSVDKSSRTSSVIAEVDFEESFIKNNKKRGASEALHERKDNKKNIDDRRCETINCISSDQKPILKDEAQVNYPTRHFQLQETTNNFPGQFRIIVTDAQNNIIEEDSIESVVLGDTNFSPTPHDSGAKNETSDLNTNKKDTKKVADDNIKLFEIQISEPTKNSINRSQREKEEKTGIRNLVNNDNDIILSKERRPYVLEDKGTKVNLKEKETNTGENKNSRNILEIFRASPARILSDTANENTSHKKNIKDLEKTHRPKMSRPQILHVIDSSTMKRSKDNNDNRPVAFDPQNSDIKTEKEFLKKIDSVRCYWSKINQDEGRTCTTKSEENELKNNLSLENSERNFVTNLDQVDSFQTNRIDKPNKVFSQSKIGTNEDFQSFSPTVEIIELNGKKQATIVKARNLDSADFDHIRYKVIKSDLFQKNILMRSTKESQFDGLMQYLQDYSFQELLTNNNVVIIEPVRTKIEKPSADDATTKQHTTVNCKITGGSTGTKQRHFFYHPVRVNRELLEEELPNPDTVRNVRKFFEENLLLQPKNIGGQFTKSKSTKSIDSVGLENIKRRGYRYLTIDTSYGGTNGEGHGLRKWDSASLSSGISSSGDLSSPSCDCHGSTTSSSAATTRTSTTQEVRGHHHHHHTNGRSQKHSARKNFDTHLEHEIYTTDEEAHDANGGGTEEENDEENPCNDLDDICDTYYVSEEVLEKIRECGSSVTYFGGRMVNNRSPEQNTTSKAIIQEIREAKCNSCQPNKCPHDDDLRKQFGGMENNYGMKFKLVKSNSCSSRLELLGTEKPDRSVSNSPAQYSTTESPIEPEESVRDLVHRLETGNLQRSTAPRIIESKCIEKITPSHSITDIPLTINSQLIESKGDRMGPIDILKHVRVNNHISFGARSPLSASREKLLSNDEKKDKIADLNNSELSACNRTMEKPISNQPATLTINGKVRRNKNVDLAFQIAKNEDISSDKTINSASSTTTTNNNKLLKTKDNENEKELNGRTIVYSHQQEKNANGVSNKKDKCLQYHVNSLELHKTLPVVKELERKSLTDNSYIHQDRKKITSLGKDEHKILASSHKIEHRDAINVGINNIAPGSLAKQYQLHPRPSEREKILETNGQRMTSTITNLQYSTTNLKSTSNSSPSGIVIGGTSERQFEKHFVANDKRLTERRKYDEIEFEEFEVYDPVTMAKNLQNENSNNGNKSDVKIPAVSSVGIGNGGSDESYDSLDDRL